ncbi:MAG: hypothetical protein R3182_14400 [Draconibacterium sp.]|nr:hypothetical protein [Draconibacterium sp.]
MEKSQEEIRFTNLYYESKGGFWRHYEPGTMGNILHWIHTYGTLNLAEGVQLGNGQITWFGRDMMKYKENPECPDVPYFYDLKYPEFQFLIENQKVYLEGLKKFPKLVEEIDAKYNEFKKILK